MRSWMTLALIVGAGFLTGCGSDSKSEVPKNPVPMEKPGAASSTPGGAPGKAAPTTAPEPLPK